MISFFLKHAIKLLQLLCSKGAGCYQDDSCGRKYLPCSQHLQLLACLLPVGNLQICVPGIKTNKLDGNTWKKAFTETLIK